MKEKKYLLKDKQPYSKGHPVVFETKHGMYAIYHIYATYDKDRNMWTGCSGLTDGVDIPAHEDDIWWEFD